MFREHTTFVCMDDKHHCKVGEPDHPVAAVDRGKRVLVSKDAVFAVSDHDFTKFQIVPSVTMLLDIPEKIHESFYRGQVYVGVKDLALEPSSPIRHMTELENILNQEDATSKPIVLLYTDGGPDHRLTYLSVQLALICLYLRGNYDMLIAARTPPMSSWKNPPERIMSILNLALQCVGLMRRKASDECEKKLNSVSGMSKLRELTSDPEMKNQILDSMEPVKILLNELFGRLRLKDRQFKTFPPASDADMDAMMCCFDAFGDAPLNCKQNAQQLTKDLKKRPDLMKLIDHCTITRTYFFCIKKCGADDCQICAKPRLPPEVFQRLHVLPDPEPGEDDHYKPFEDVYGTYTSEKYLPSAVQKQQTGHQIPFSPSAQTVRTVKMLVYCVDCEKPQVIYALQKIPEPDKDLLKRLLEFLDYSCGGSLQDLKSPEESAENELIDKVFVRANITCQSAIEIPYFSSGCLRDVCFNCGDVNSIERVDGQYPSCTNCRDTKKVCLKRKRNIWNEQDKTKKKKAKKVRGLTEKLCMFLDIKTVS